MTGLCTFSDIGELFVKQSIICYIIGKSSKQ